MPFVQPAAQPGSCEPNCLCCSRRSKRSAIAAVRIPAAPALALTQREIDRCVGKNVAPELQIDGCTAAIQSEGLSPSDLAAAYHNRGLAYAKRDDLKDAIAEFDQATGSTHNLPVPTTIGASLMPDRGVSTLPSPTSMKPSGSIRQISVTGPDKVEAGEPGDDHCRVNANIRIGFPQPRLHALRRARVRPRYRRLRCCDPARSEKHPCLQRPR
jgi:hypothetical protein